MNIIADEIKLKQDVVTYRVCEKLKEFLSSTYKCNFLGADNKQ